LRKWLLQGGRRRPLHALPRCSKWLCAQAMSCGESKTLRRNKPTRVALYPPRKLGCRLVGVISLDRYLGHFLGSKSLAWLIPCLLQYQLLLIIGRLIYLSCCPCDLRGCAIQHFMINPLRVYVENIGLGGGLYEVGR
jgi:hypothetical protein